MVEDSKNAEVTCGFLAKIEGYYPPSSPSTPPPCLTACADLGVSHSAIRGLHLNVHTNWISNNIKYEGTNRLPNAIRWKVHFDQFSGEAFFCFIIRYRYEISQIWQQKNKELSHHI